MLFSLSLILLCGMLLGSICIKLKLPKLLGMLICGIILGPFVLNLIDPSVLNISADLRQIALIIILTRAGLNLDIKDLLKVGRPAILMCFLPACFEILGMILIAPKLLNISILEAAIMGTVLGAVSPAVIVPKMLKLMDEGYGNNKSIPQMILAGASVDDVFVIVLFTAFTNLATGGSISPITILNIPIAIILGLILGIVTGILLCRIFKIIHMRDSSKVIIILSIAFLFVSLEHALNGIISISGLLAVMSMGIAIQKYREPVALRLSKKFDKLWVGAELLLFVLVGASVNIEYALASGIKVIMLIFCVLMFRMLGVFICLIKTNLNKSEKVFTMIAYTPKATVQAAIGSIPLAMGLACGNIVLSVAVMSILITAPLGSFLIDLLYKKCLTTNKL
ncbi:MAG: cation:proton antiporter [Erysipelotrichaceae bacterium]